MTDKYESPLSSRYASDYMLKLFSSDTRYRTWRRLWVSLAKAEKKLGLPISDEQIAELENNIDNIDFILSMSEYKTKLRIYKNNKKIYDKKSDPRALISLNVGDEYIDPIFNKIEVLSKEFSENILKLKLKAKSGIYILKFIKS